MDKDYYYFHWKKSREGTAYSPKDNDIEFIEQLEGFDKVPFPLMMEDGLFQDYLANDLGWPIFSKRFKKIIEPYLSIIDAKWILVAIDDSNGKQEIFYILKFNNSFDILDTNKTIFADDFVVKAVLSKNKVKDMNVFIVPDSDFRIIVSQDVKSIIEQNKLTGIEFSKVPCTP